MALLAPALKAKHEAQEERRHERLVDRLERLYDKAEDILDAVEQERPLRLLPTSRLPKMRYVR